MGEGRVYMRKKGRKQERNRRTDGRKRDTEAQRDRGGERKTAIRRQNLNIHQYDRTNY